MSDKYIIGVDNGSQSTKVMIFNQKGEVIVSESEPLRPMLHRKPGYVEHPDDDLWDSIKSVLKKTMSCFKYDTSSIIGLGLCTIRCCRVFMKKDGTLAEPVMSWMDIRAYETFEDREDIAYTCPTTGYITHRLTGELRDTAANSFQWQFPIDMDSWQWTQDSESFGKYKIPKEKLLKLQMPGTILGYVTEEAAAATGLPVGLPVVGTASDKAVEALGSGLVEQGRALISLGTYIASMVHAKENKPETKDYFTNFSCVPNEYLYESGGIRRGMSHVSWFRDMLGEEYAKKAKSEGCLVEEYLEKDAISVPPGADGLLTVPDWLAPPHQLYRKGIMLGFQGLHTKGHIYRSILEGIAMTLKTNYDAMTTSLNICPEKIIISGGGSNSDMFMQIFADMYGVTTVRNKVNGAVALGSAICVAVAMGVYGDFREAVGGMVEKRDEFTSNKDSYKIYQKIINGVYKDLPELTETVMKRAYNAFN